MEKTLYGRVGLKTGNERFFRCGIAFTREWQKVVVDEATAKRLQEEQMLEVSDTRPEDYAEEAAAASGSGDSAPTAPAERNAAIKDAIGKLNVDNAALWKADGAPNTAAIVAVVGWNVTAAERDAVWAEIQAAP